MIARLAKLFAPLQAIVLLLAACSAWCPAAHPQGPLAAEAEAATVKKILELWSKRRSLVKTAMWECEGKAVIPRGWCDPPDDVSVPGAGERHYPEEDFEYDCTLKLWIDFERERIRREPVVALCQNLEETGRADPLALVQTCVFDGKYTVVSYAPEWMAHQWAGTPQVVIDEGMRFFVVNSEYAFAFVAAGMVDVPSQVPFYRGEDPSRFHIVGRATHQGRECVVVRTEVRPPSVKHYDIWVDVERDGAIVKRVSYANAKPTFTLNVEYGPVAGTWMPTEYSFAGGPHWPSGRMKVTRLELQAPIDPEVFRLVVDAGTIIQNNLTNEVYAGAERGDVLHVRRSAHGQEEKRLSFTTWAAVIIACLLALRIGWGVLSRKKGVATSECAP